MFAYCKTPAYNKVYDVTTSGKTGTPISLQEVKDHLIITFADDDTLLTRLIDQCISAIEMYCAISIFTRTITVSADLVNDFELPYGPVISFTSFTQNGTAQTLTNVPIAGFSSYYPGPTGRAVLVYQAGNYLPESLKLAVLNEIAFRYENRGDGVNRYANQNVGISAGAQALADPYRRLSWL